MLHGEQRSQLFREYMIHSILKKDSKLKPPCVICRVPILLFVAAMILIFGQDHPAGRWSDRLTAATIPTGQNYEDARDNIQPPKGKDDLEGAVVTIEPVEEKCTGVVQSTVDVAVNESITFRKMITILTTPLTWLPALAYLTTLGVELSLDSKMADVFFSLYSKSQPGFTQTSAGYYASVL
jgi:NNP family nitrate/nitrite transporter-like MFS transporter